MKGRLDLEVCEVVVVEMLRRSKTTSGGRQTCKNGLRERTLNSKLTKRMPRDMHDLRAKTSEFSKKEEDNVSKMATNKWGDRAANASTVQGR